MQDRIPAEVAKPTAPLTAHRERNGTFPAILVLGESVVDPSLPPSRVQRLPTAFAPLYAGVRFILSDSTSTRGTKFTMSNMTIVVGESSLTGLATSGALQFFDFGVASSWCVQNRCATASV
jgi:hypothetical protein